MPTSHAHPRTADCGLWFVGHLHQAVKRVQKYLKVVRDEFGYSTHEAASNPALGLWNRTHETVAWGAPTKEGAAFFASSGNVDCHAQVCGVCAAGAPPRAALMPTLSGSRVHAHVRMSGAAFSFRPRSSPFASPFS